jgi:hypothetical protein
LSSAEQKPRRSGANELFKKSGNRRVEVNLAKAVRCFESLFDPTVMNFLLDKDGQEIRRDVFVNLDTKRLSDSETTSTAQNENHPLPFSLPPC